MLTQTQRNAIHQRLTEASNKSSRTDGLVDDLIEEFNLITGMPDDQERTDAESQFLTKLIDVENTITHLKGRMKI